MPDTYTTRGGLIKPEPGSSLNTWGTKLNGNNFDIADKALFGVETIAVTTDFSLTRTNGDSSSTQINKAILLGGTPTAAFTVTALNYEHVIRYINDSGRAATVKVTAGTGVTLQDGEQADLGYNATLGDIANVSPNVIPGNARVGGALTVAGQISGVTAATTNTQAVNLIQMSNAIAAATTSSSPGTVRVTSIDTTAKFLSQAVTQQVGGLTTTQISGLMSLQISTVNPSGNEQLALTLSQGYVGGFLNGGTKSSQFTPDVGTAYDCDVSSDFTVNLGGMSSVQVGHELKLCVFGTGGAFLLGTVNGLTNQRVTEGIYVPRYSGSTRGWIYTKQSGGGVHFTDPREFKRVIATSSAFALYDDTTLAGGHEAGFWTEMGERGVAVDTDYSAGVAKSLLNVTGKGLIAAVIGPTAGGAETTTFAITVDGVARSIAVSVTSGKRAVLMPGHGPAAAFTTSASYLQSGGDLDAGKAMLTATGANTLLATHELFGLFGTPLLQFQTSCVITCAHSANVTGTSNNERQSGVMYLVQG